MEMSKTTKIKDLDCTAEFRGVAIPNLPMDLGSSLEMRLLNHMTVCTLSENKGRKKYQGYAFCSRPTKIPRDKDGNQVFDQPKRGFGRHLALQRAVELRELRREDPNAKIKYGICLEKSDVEVLGLNDDDADYEVWHVVG
jgi:hypothetical protein